MNIQESFDDVRKNIAINLKTLLVLQKKIEILYTLHNLECKPSIKLKEGLSWDNDKNLFVKKDEGNWIG